MQKCSKYLSIALCISCLATVPLFTTPNNPQQLSWIVERIQSIASPYDCTDCIAKVKRSLKNLHDVSPDLICRALDEAMEILQKNHEKISSDKEVQEIMRCIDCLYSRANQNRNMLIDDDLIVEGNLLVEGTSELRGHVGIGQAPGADALDVIGNINLTNSTSSATGNILKNGAPFITNPGTNNTFIGINAGNFSTTGFGNVVVGDYAFVNNTSGDNNVAVGVLALTNNTEGIQNTALGSHALYTNTVGNNNVGLGESALGFNTSGNSNVAVGYQAAFANTTADSNLAIGNNALYSNHAGTQNVALGQSALGFVDGGSNNIAIGYLAGINLQNGTANNNNILIGHPGGSAYDGVIIIGNGSQTTTFISGIDAANLGASANIVGVGAYGQLGSAATTFNLSGNEVASGSITGTATNGAAIISRESTNINKQTIMGYDTTNDQAFIGGVEQGVGFKSLALYIPGSAGTTVYAHNINLVGSVTAGTGLNVTGATVLNGNVGIAGNIGITGNTNHYGNFGIAGDVGITGTTNHYGNVGIAGNVGITGNTSHYGNFGIAGDVGITGTTNHYGYVGIAGNVGITGNSAMYGDLDVTTRVKIGTGYAATSHDTKSRIEWARIADDGTLLDHSNGVQSVSKLGTGSYEITYVPGLIITPAVSVTPEAASISSYATVISSDATQTIIDVETGVDAPFDIVVFGLQ